MNRILVLTLSGLVSLLLAGCSGWGMRTSSSLKPRVDQQVSGNRGFVSGKPSSAAKEPAFTDRKVYQVEIEMPELIRKRIPLAERKSAAKTADQKLWGNRGYLKGGKKESGLEETTVEPPAIVIEKPKTTMPESASGSSRTYTARKGDTLQKISLKFYGTTKKWPQLFKANKDKLKTADKLYPGQILIIPELGDFKK